MNLELLYSLILTVLPVSELRLGLPLAIDYALKEGVPIFYVFSLIVLLNIVMIFFIFYFLDNLHKIFLKSKFYRRAFEIYLIRLQKKIDKFEKKHESLGILALTFFVAIPLPGTGAWSGSILAWALGLERKKSIAAIALGVVIAGILILLGTLGVIKILG